MKSPGSATPRYLGAALIILAAGLIGYFAYRAKSAGDSTAPAVSTSPPTPVNAVVPASPPPPVNEGRKAIPDTLPDVTLADRDGKPTSLLSFGGRPLMVNFWATWCAPCRREIPLLNQISVERKSQNVTIVGIAVDFREDVLKFVQETPLNYPLLIGEEDGMAAADAFGMGMAFPFSVFVDSQNRILTVKIGELHEDEANFAFDRIRDIDNGALTREAAQAMVADAFRQMAADRAKTESAAATKTDK